MSPMTARVSGFAEPVLTGLPTLRAGWVGRIVSGVVHAEASRVAHRAKYAAGRNCDDGVVGRDTKGPPLKGNGCEQRQLAARRPRPGERLVSDVSRLRVARVTERAARAA